MSRRSSHAQQFKHVYDDVYPIIIRIVYRITGDLDSAEELCQDAFIRFYERMDTIADGEQAKYWLIRVSKNLALNFQKRRGRERRAYERVFREPQRKQESGETAVLKDESSQAVKHALDLLPESLRTVIIMKEYGELSYKEIASVLGISEGNVKVRVYRARERLAEHLKEGDIYVP